MHAVKEDLTERDLLEGENDENVQSNNHHKDFGKVPKYLAKYKEEAE